MESTDNSNHSLWVGGLHLDVQEGDLKSTFTNAHNIKLCQDISSNVSLGHAYLNYHQEADGKIDVLYIMMFAFV